MAINLTSRLSAIATDSSGQTYVVWVEANRLWCAVYDPNSATWKNAQAIAEIGTETVQGLNLIFSESLIQVSGSTDTRLPGLAVVYQQGTDNDSNFFYTAAQYDANGNLQWLDTPQALTADQVADLEPQAIAYQENGSTNVLVVGQKVNVDNSGNLGVKEDTDLYYQIFSINSNQFTTPQTESSPNANYAPQTSKDGVVQGNLYIYPGQSSTAPNALLSLSATSNNSNSNGRGFNWNASESFNTNLLSLDFFRNPPGTVPNGVLSGIFNKIYLSGTLQGSSGNNPELTLFGGGDANSDNNLYLNAIASLGVQEYSSETSNLDGSRSPTNNNDNYQGGLSPNEGASFSPSITLATLYSYINDPSQNFPLYNMTGSLGVSVGLNVPILGLSTGEDKWALQASLNLVGSVGVFFQWQDAPTSPGSYQAPIAAYLAPNPNNIGGDTTLAAVAVVPVVDAAAAIALALGGGISDAVNLANGDLTSQSYLLGIPLSAGLEGILQIPLLFQLSASAKIFLAGTLGRTNQQKDESFTLGFPLSATLKLLGFLGGTIEYFPSWTWGTVPGSSSSNTSSVSSAPAFAASPSSLLAIPTLAEITAPTASVNGSLLTIDFPTNLDTSVNPSPTDFTVTVTNPDGTLVTIPVFGVIVQANSVILRLAQTIAYSTLNDQPFSNIQVTYNPVDQPLEDTQAEPIPAFTNLAVINNTSQNFVYTYNPTNGTNANYTNSLQQITLNFNTLLSTNAVPYVSQFVVTDNTNSQTIKVTEVSIYQNNVTLTLASQINSGDNYTVNYTPNSASSNNLQEVNYQLIPSFSVSDNTPTTQSGITINASLNTLTTNQVISGLAEDFAQDSSPALALTQNGQILLAWSSDSPYLLPISALANGNNLYLSFGQDLANNQTSGTLPSADQFMVSVNCLVQSLNPSEPPNVNGNTVILTLNQAIAATDTVTVTYNPPSFNTNSLNFVDPTGTTFWIQSFNDLSVTISGDSITAPTPLNSVINGHIYNGYGLNQFLIIPFNQTLLIPGNGEISTNDFIVLVNGQKINLASVLVNQASVILSLANNSIGQGDLVSVTYNSQGQLRGSNGQLVTSFLTNAILTTPPTASTVIKSAFSPFGDSGISSISTIPGTNGLNSDAVAILDSNTNSNVIAWVHIDGNALPNQLIPGQTYSERRAKEINNSLSNSDIYYSVLGPNNQWSVATAIAPQQPGQDQKVTLGQGPNGQLMAAWLNNQSDSNGEVTTAIYWSSWDGSTWTNPQALFSETTPDPATDLSISSVNGQPAIFWTNTQPSSYGDRVFNQNPLLYLRLGDWQGTTAKNSGQLLAAANGTYNGDFTLRQMGALENPVTQNGDRNPAVLFSGGNVTLNTATPVNNQGFTVEFWFKLPSLLSKGESLNLAAMAGIFSLTLEGLGTGTALTFSLANDAGSMVQSLSDNNGQELETGQWYYVAGTYDGNNQILTLYLNGAPVGSVSNVNFADVPSSGTLTLAGSSGAVYLDEVAFYNTVLTYADVSASEVTAANFQNLTGTQLVEILSGANQIGNHYEAQYITPLPPGPQTHYSVWDSTTQTWQDSSQIEPFLQPTATALADANNPIWDIVSDSVSQANGFISPNGNPDSIFQVTLTGQQSQTLVGISLSANGQTYSIGQDQNGNLLVGNQLGVLLGDKLLNSLNPDGVNFSHLVMGATENLSLFADGGGSNNSTVTFYFAGNNKPLSSTAIAQSNQGNSVSANGTDLLGTTVTGIATVTEANDSSLSLIDSGFVINTNNAAIGAVLASAFQNGSLAYVAMGNRGYTDIQGNPLNGGTLQILFAGGQVLSNNESNPLTTTDLTGNPDGVLITGLTDTGTANKNVAISLATGDIDGDGIDDLVIGDANANGGNGAIYVFYGSYLNSLKNQNQTINISQLSTTPSNQGFLINGLDEDGFAGFAVAVGNFNGDSYEDIAFGSPLASNNGTTGAGKVYVVNGFAQSSSPDLTPNLIYTGQTFNIPNPQNASTTVTVGEGAGFSLGVSHYTSGNATTFSGSTTTDDLFIGAPGYQVIVTNQWNGKSGLPSDSQSLYPDTTAIAAGAVHVLSSSQGFQNGPISTYRGPGVPGANGVAANYFAGTAIASSDFMDMDGDGQQDLAISATGVNSNTGAVYVISGSTASKSTSPQDLSQVSNLIINGGLTGSKTGTVITSAGDINDDGYQDFLITSPQAGNGAGQNYVVFGPLTLDQLGTVFDLNVTASDNKTTFLLNGSEPLQLTGTATIAVGDINNDGVDDLMLTAPNAQQAYAVFGHPWLADDGSLKLADISADNGFVIDGAELGLASNGTLLSVLGDINNDGFADVFSGGSDGGVIIFGGSTKSLIDASLTTRELILTLSDGGELTEMVAIADYNGDGLSDFGVLSNQQTFYLILGSPDLGTLGNLSLSDSIPQVSNIDSASPVGDINGDGFDDLLLNDTLFFGNAEGLLTDSGVTGNPKFNTNANGVGDVNGDGYDDVGSGNPNANVVNSNISAIGNGQGDLYFGNGSANMTNAIAITAPDSELSTSFNPDGYYFYSSSGNPSNNTLNNFQTYNNSAPTFAVYNGYLYMAFVNSGADICIGRSLDGYHWDVVVLLENYQSEYTPSLAVYNDTLYLAFTGKALDKNNSDVFLAPATLDNNSPLGLYFPDPPFQIGNETTTSAGPSLVTYQDQLYLFFKDSKESAPPVRFTSSSNPSDSGSWPVSQIINDSNGDTLETNDAIGVTTSPDGSQLIITYKDNRSTYGENGIFYTAVYDGGSWINTQITQGDGSAGDETVSGPSLITINNQIYLFYASENDNNGDLYYRTSSDGTHWSSALQLVGQAVQLTNNPDSVPSSRVLPTFFQQSPYIGYAGTDNQELGIAVFNPLYEPNQTQQFGSQFQNIGDFNGDGLDDFAVLVPGYKNLDPSLFEPNQGAVYIYYGSSAPRQWEQPDVVLATPPGTYPNNPPNDNGELQNVVNLSNFSTAGDINGDGFDDLLIASPFTTLSGISQDPSIDGDQGIIWVVFGGLQWQSQYSTTQPFNLGTLSNNQSESNSSNTNGFIITGLPNSEAGIAISGGQDINGDGFADWAIAAPGNNDNLSYVLFGSDFNHTVNQTGTIGNDVMLGTPTGESFVSGEGDDYINTGGGIDVVYAGQGNDWITVSDTYFRRIDGGTGSDRLKFTGYNGQDWDLTTLSPGTRLQNIEVLDLRNYGANQLTLNSLTVTNLSSNNTLTVWMDSEDTLVLSSDFIYSQTVYQNGRSYSEFQGGNAKVLVNIAGNNNASQLLMQADGNLVEYSVDQNGNTTPIWATNTATEEIGGSPATYAIMQLDGNLVLYTADNQVVWASNTGGENSSYAGNSLALFADDGTLGLVKQNSDGSYSLTYTIYQGAKPPSASFTNQSNPFTLLLSGNSLVANTSTDSINTSIPINNLNFGANLQFTAPIANSPVPILNPDSISTNGLIELSETANTEMLATNLSPSILLSQPDAPTQLFVSNPTVSEAAGVVNFTIQRTGDLNKAVLVSYITQDGDGKAGDRYLPVAGRALFAPGETIKTVTVPIPNDGIYTGDRQFGLAVTLEGESLDPSVVPDAWEAAIATLNEQIRRWKRIPGENGDSVAFDITSGNSTDQVVTFDVDLDGMVMPLIWNPATESYENVPFSDVNGITQFQDIDGDLINDLYRMQFQDGGPFDGDRLVNGLVALDFKLAQLKPVDVPSTGGRIEGTEGNDYISAQNSTGTNRLQGLGGMDILLGSPQRDVLIGGDSNDQLFGGAGVDQLFGEAGNDTLDGGTGLDFLYGGAGADNFVLRTGDGPDRVMDFNATEGDIFLLDNLTLGALSFAGNQIFLETDLLATVVNVNGQPVTTLAENPQWFISMA